MQVPFAILLCPTDIPADNHKHDNVHMTLPVQLHTEWSHHPLPKPDSGISLLISGKSTMQCLQAKEGQSIHRHAPWLLRDQINVIGITELAVDLISCSDVLVISELIDSLTN